MAPSRFIPYQCKRRNPVHQPFSCIVWKRPPCNKISTSSSLENPFLIIHGNAKPRTPYQKGKLYELESILEYSVIQEQIFPVRIVFSRTGWEESCSSLFSDLIHVFRYLRRQTDRTEKDSAITTTGGWIVGYYSSNEWILFSDHGGPDDVCRQFRFSGERARFNIDEQYLFRRVLSLFLATALSGEERWWIETLLEFLWRWEGCWYGSVQLSLTV